MRAEDFRHRHDDVTIDQKAAVYARISSDDGTPLGVTGQLPDYMVLAESRGCRMSACLYQPRRRLWKRRAAPTPSPKTRAARSRSLMVNLSDDAAGLIRSLVSDSNLPQQAGLRLGTDDDTHALAMNLEAQPRPDDVVVEHEGASLYVHPVAGAR